MYSSSQQAELILQAKTFLNTACTEAQLNELKDILRFADWTYYVNDNPILADVEYDTLFKQLKKLEENNPQLITLDSPTQRVAKGLNKDFPSVAHLVPMLSLENSYDADDLIDWERKCKELSGEENIEFCVEPKFDGASISLVYENDFLFRAATRGDGVQGDTITNNSKQIRSIPLKAELSKYGISQIEIRGEVLIDKKTFAAYNEKLMNEGLAPLANARNAASGSLRLKDPNEVAKRGLDAYLYNVSNMTVEDGKIFPHEFSTHFNTLKTLDSLGFKTSAHHTKLLTGIDKVIALCNEFETQRDNLPYEIDGMVIKVNRVDLQERIGQTSHHPRWAIAFKFKARQATSKLLQVEYQVGRTGSVTPVAKIEPVFVGGVTISSLSLFNEEVVKEKNLMLGDTVLIERAGDVIPYVVKSFPELRNGKEVAIVFPTDCPVCNEKLVKPEEEAVWRCANINCEAQVIERIAHFASKDAMDIRGLGDALVRKLFEYGYLKTLDGIYNLPYDKLQQMEGFGEKSMLNLKEAIEKSKAQPLNRLIFALGIRYVGETTAKTLTRNISHLHDLYNLSFEQLCTFEDVGKKVASSIVDFFLHPDNRALIASLQAQGLNLENQVKQTIKSGGLTGKTFLFTGTLTMKRSEAEALAESKGANILGSVSSKLNYLVVGEDAGSKLEKAKKLGSIHILSEPEFLTLISESE